MNIAAWKARAMEYIDDQSQMGNHTAPSEVTDAFRTYDDHPRDEGLLSALTHRVLIALLDDGAIVGHNDGPDEPIAFDVAPKE